jgi:predicted metal-binding protein
MLIEINEIKKMIQQYLLLVQNKIDDLNIEDVEDVTRLGAVFGSYNLAKQTLKNFLFDIEKEELKRKKL